MQQIIGFDKSQFPLLSQKRVWPWGPIQAEFETDSEPPSELISNVNMVPYVENGDWVIIRHGGCWGITGGTLEPGEGYLAAIERELVEEAGARLISFEYLGAWHCHSQADRPYKPHLPWPEFFRVVGYGQVEIVGDPGNPEDGEQVSEVACLPLEEACSRLSSKPDDGPELAEVYRLAALAKSTRVFRRPNSI